jgi:ABC-2 type transport system ATP-binding protein
LPRPTPDGKLQRVHDQAQPVREFGEHDLPLHGTDQLGLVVFGYHPQYFNYYTKLPVTVKVSGITAGLPFLNEDKPRQHQ